jgi:hypothetical protein
MARISIHPLRDGSQSATAEADTSEGACWVRFTNGADEIVFFFDGVKNMPKAEALRDAYLALFAPKQATAEAEAA